MGDRVMPRFKSGRAQSIVEGTERGLAERTGRSRSDTPIPPGVAPAVRPGGFGASAPPPISVLNDGFDSELTEAEMEEFPELA